MDKKAWILRRQKNATDEQITLRNQRASIDDIPLEREHMD